MTKLKPGDRVNCRLKEGSIVVAYKDYDEVKTFEIIAVDEDDYYIFVPSYVFVKETVIVDQYRAKSFDISSRFIGEQMSFINQGMVASISREMDGMCCSRCQDFILMAQPNQKDGKTFICWSCRDNPYI